MNILKHLKSKILNPKYHFLYSIFHIPHSIFRWFTATRRRKILSSVLAVLVLVTSIRFIFFKPEETQAAWSATHGSYLKRKQITLINNSGQTFESGTTYKITIDTKALYDSGSLLSSCDDLRIVYQPDDATAIELNRNIEYASGTTCSTSTASKIVFQLQANISNSSTDDDYYLYYDNPDASTYAQSDALDAYNVGTKEATFVAPFNGTTTALAAGSGTPTTESGAIRYSGSKSALSFDGINDAVTSSSGTSIFDITKGTVELWAYSKLSASRRFVGGYTDMIFSARYGNTNSRIYIELCSNGNLCISFSDTYIIDTGDTLTPNTWHHIALVWDNSTSVRVYLDGTNVHSATRTALSDIPSEIAVGSYIQNATNYPHFNGLVDEVRVSNVARYSSNFTPQTNPFVRDEYTKLLYHFDENGDDPRNTGKAIDDSGNGNHGTIAGAKYAAGLVGTDNSSTTTGYQYNQSYASHQGIFLEEGVTNIVTNPSFEHSTFDTGWTASSSASFNANTTASYYKFGSKSAHLDSANTRYHRDDTASYGGDGIYRYTSNKRLAQGFQVTQNLSPNFVLVQAAGIGTLTGKYVRMEINTDSSGVPSGTVVSNGVTNCINATTLPTTFPPQHADALQNFSFPTPPSLSASTQYHLVFRVFSDSSCATEQSSADADNFVYWFYDDTSATYSDGSRALMNESNSWTSYSSHDYHFALGENGVGNLHTTINPGNTNTHTLSAYVYNASVGYIGGEVSSTFAQLIFNGTAQTTTYTDMGGGWWRLTYTGTPGSGSQDYGVKVKDTYHVYIDGVQLEEPNESGTEAFVTSYTDGSLGTGYSWSGTAHESTSIRTGADLDYSSTNNISCEEGSISFWYKKAVDFPSSGEYYPFVLSASDGLSSGIKFDRGYRGSYMRLAVYGYNPSYYGYAAVTLTTSWAVGAWHHIVGTWEESGNVRVYIDGSETVGDATGDLEASCATSIVFDSSNESESNNISDLRSFDSRLSATEITDLYYSGLGAFTEQETPTERFTDGEPPVLVWHMDGGYGTIAYDSTVNLNHGSISGATWSEDSFGGAPKTMSLKFDGTDDYVSRTYSQDSELSPSTEPFAVSAWFKAPSSVSSIMYLVSRYSSGGYKVYMNTSGQLCFGVDDDSTWGPNDEACTTESYADSKWHHVMAVKGASTISVYVDGNLKKSTNTTVSSSLSGFWPTFYVGVDSGGSSNYWKGFIDEVRVYNSARSEEQIKMEYNARGSNKGVSAQFGAGGDTLNQGLVGYWKMDETSADTCPTGDDSCDSSGNLKDGAWNGGATSGSGKFGSGVTMDGTGDYIEVEDIDL